MVVERQTFTACAYETVNRGKGGGDATEVVCSHHGVGNVQDMFFPGDLLCQLRSVFGNTRVIDEGRRSADDLDLAAGAIGSTNMLGNLPGIFCQKRTSLLPVAADRCRQLRLFCNGIDGAPCMELAKGKDDMIKGIDPP